MRLEAKKGPPDALFRVWDCPACRWRRDIVWVDDEQGSYGYWEPPNTLRKEKAKVLIVPEVRIVFLNPLLDRETLIEELTEIVMEQAQ